MTDESTTETAETTTPHAPTKAAEAAEAQTDWRASLPDDVRNAPALQNFDTIEGLAKSYLNAKSLQGQSIRIPSESASAEAKAEFRKRLKESVPDLLALPDDTASDDEWVETYKRLGAPDAYDLPQDAQHLSHLKDLAQAGVLTKRQYNGMLSKALEADRVHREQQEVKQATWAQELQTAWGASKDAKLARILRMTEIQGAPAEFHKAIQQGQVPPSMLMFMDKVADALAGEGADLTSAPDSASKVRMTPEAVQAEIGDILQNPDYWDVSKPRNKFLKKRMMDLQSMT